MRVGDFSEFSLQDFREKGYSTQEAHESDDRLLEYIKDVKSGKVADGTSTVRQRYANDEGLMSRCDTVDSAIQGQIDLFLDMLIISQGEARAYRNLFNGLREMKHSKPGTSAYRQGANKASLARRQLENIAARKAAMDDDYIDYNPSRKRNT